jgi:hypothetical protein
MSLIEFIPKDAVERLCLLFNLLVISFGGGSSLMTKNLAKQVDKIKLKVGNADQNLLIPT